VKLGRASVALVASALLLTSCSFPAWEQRQGGAAIQRNGNDLVIALCKSIVADTALMGERNVEEDIDWSEFWSFRDGGELNEGALLSTDPALSPPFPDEVRRQPRLHPGDGIEVLLSEDGGSAIHAIFKIRPEGLSESEWLQADGSVSSSPCSSPN